MPDAFHFGPLYLNGAVLAHILAGIIAWLVIRWWTKKQHVFLSLDVLLNAMLIIVLFWKFGWVLSRLDVIWESPMNLILLTGSAREVWIGVAIAVVYASIAVIRQRIPWRLMLDLMVLLILAYIMVKSALSVEYGRVTSMPWGWSPLYEGLSYHPVHWYRAIAVGLLLLWLRLRAWKPGHGHYAAKGLLFYGMIKLALSFFDRETALMLYLTFDQIIAVLTILLGYVMNHRSIIRQEGSDRND
jgi:hypothetical protein